MDRRIAREALRLMDAHLDFVRATVVDMVGSVPAKTGSSMLLRPDGSFLGTVGGAALEEQVKEICRRSLSDRASALHTFDLAKWRDGGLPSLCGGRVTIAIEFVPARPNLLLWGGGHVAQSLATILPTLEYDYSVADDRPDWVGADRFPHADRREVVRPAELWERFEPAAFTHLYILGYDAILDTEVLASALERFPNVIGFIASETKRAHVYAELRRRGASDASIARIRSPVGLAIGAQSPSEIAVAIAAELIEGMRSRTRADTPGTLRPAPVEHDVVGDAP